MKFTFRNIAFVGRARGGGGGGGSGPVLPGAAVAGSWASRVQVNGGAAVSGSSVTALTTFWNALYTGGIDTKMKAVMCFAPDNLTAALTPLYKTVGNDPWTNSGGIFDSSDLTVNGLVGNGVNKYLKTGISGLAAYLSVNNCGFSIYNSTAATSTQIEFGCSITSDHMYMAIDYVGIGAIFDCWTNTTPRLQVANTGYTGFLSGNRTSSTSVRIDGANSTLPYTTKVSLAITAGALTNDEFYAFAINPVQVWTSKRISFMAIHDGLSVGEGTALFNAIQALRTAFGGGFV